MRNKQNELTVRYFQVFKLNEKNNLDNKFMLFVLIFDCVGV